MEKGFLQLECSHTSGNRVSGCWLPGKGYFGCPFCLPDCSEILRKGKEKGENTHCPGSWHGWCCPVCLYLCDWLQLNGWQVVQLAEILELIRCAEDVYPRTPGVGSRDCNGGIDTYFCEVWLS